MKRILKLIVIVVVGLLVLALAKDQILRTVISGTATAVTGAPVKIKVFSLSLLKQSVLIKDFKMYNPAGFPKEVFVDIPQIEVGLDVGALLTKKIHLKKVTLDLNELVVIKNKEGKLNVDALKVSEMPEKPAKEAPQKETPKKPAAQMPLQIDELNLNLGRVIYKDYTAGDPPKVDAYEINIKNKQYKNLTSVDQLVLVILSEPLKHTAIQGAKIFAAQAILGVGFLPAGVAMTLIGKDSSRQAFDIPYATIYDKTLSFLQGMTDRATIKKENKETGIISALVDKNDVTIKMEKLTDRSTQVTVSARRLLMPKPEVAQGLLYQISEKLK